jgi:predicted enzyme related to lactoylglutathione lyase
MPGDAALAGSNGNGRHQGRLWQDSPMLSAAIYALDVPRLASFYRMVTGGAIVSDPNGRFATVTPPMHDFEVHIVAISEAFRDLVETSSPPEPRSDTPIKLVFDVDDIEATRTAVGAAGGSLSPREAQWTWRDMIHCDGVDPEGNVFQVRSPA